MAQLADGQCDIRSQRDSRTYNNPFARRFNSRLDRAHIEDYIKAWIEDIFYNNKKIDIQAKATIYRKLISDKFYELSSCSIVYSIIREKIKEICLRLRRFINLSYEALHNQQRFLSNLTSRRDDQGVQGNGNDCLNVGVARSYVISYRYMCEVAKETFNFWKILYQCTQVKDLRFNSLQNSLNEFILQTFVQPSEVFEPRLLLPNMSFSLKCKFIYAEADGIKKREELTKFYEDDTVRRLLKRDQNRLGTQEQELAKVKSDLAERTQEEKWSLARKYEMFHKPRMDYKDLELLRREYLDPEAEATEEALFASLFPPSTQRQATFSQEKMELIRSLESNHQQLFEIEDASSQEDGPDPLFYEDSHPDREDLLDEQDNIEIELTMNPEKNLEGPQSDGSTKSQPTDQPPEQPDLPMRNYENEPPPPQFIMSEHHESGRSKQRAEVHRAIQLLSQYSHERKQSSSSSESQEQKMAKLKLNIAKSKQMRQREKKVEFLDKKQLEEEKEKLEKYRKELEKEKEELLREVEKFMKEKKKESNLLALMKDNKPMHKFSTRSYKCNGINHKIIHKIQKHQQKIQSITLKYDLKELKAYACQDHYHIYPNNNNTSNTTPTVNDCPHQQQQRYLPDSPLPSLDSSMDSSLSHIIEDKAKMKQIQEAVAKDLLGEGKLTKKQQKLKKKLQHESAIISIADESSSPIKLESKKSERSGMSEQEAILSNFLERLRIDEDTRVPCNVEEKHIMNWKTRTEHFRKHSPATEQPLLEQKEQEVVVEAVAVEPEITAVSAKTSSKKRKKNRR